MATAPPVQDCQIGQGRDPVRCVQHERPQFRSPGRRPRFAEKSVKQARDAYSKLKTAADEATDLVEDTFETAREGTFAIGVKAIDAAKSNSDASFAFAKDLLRRQDDVRGHRDAVDLRPQAVRRRSPRSSRSSRSSHREAGHRHDEAGDREGREDLQGTQGRLTRRPSASSFLKRPGSPSVPGRIRSFAPRPSPSISRLLNAAANPPSFRPPSDAAVAQLVERRIVDP